MALSNVVTEAPDAAGRGHGSSALARIGSSKPFQASITAVAFLAIFIAYAIWLGSAFASTEARFLDIHQNAPVLLLGLAVLVTLIAGQFDLSVGGMATLTTYLVIGLKINENWPFLLVLAVCLAIGLVGGLVNGLLVVRLRVNTFIATLGTGGVFAGLGSVYGKGTQLAPTTESHQLPGWFSGPGSFGSFGEKLPSPVLWIGLALTAVWLFLTLRHARPAHRSQRTWDLMVAGGIVLAALVLVALGLPSWVDAVSWTIGLLLAVGVALWILLTRTTFGRYLHATGSNPTAARLAGVKPDKETLKAFVLGGFLAALAGVVLAANQGSASPDVAVGFLLPAFAAAFLSTVVFSTGHFTVWGTLIGGTCLVWVSQGLIVGGLAFTWTDVVNGVVLVFAVALSTIFRRSN